MNPTQQAHQNLRNLLLNGRILINGMPPTANEIGGVIQGEQMLFEKATQLDKAQEIAASRKEPKKPVKPGGEKKQKSKVVPIQEGAKKDS